MRCRAISYLKRREPKGMHKQVSLVIAMAGTLLTVSACNNTDTRRQRGAGRADSGSRQGAPATKTIAAGLAAEQPVPSRRQGGRPRPDSRRPRPLYRARARRRGLRVRSCRHVRRQAGESRPADRSPHQPDPAGHRARRGHRQGDRGRQGQGGAGDHGRRNRHRDQGGRQDRPDRQRPATRRRSPRPTSNSPMASSTASARC